MSTTTFLHLKILSLITWIILLFPLNKIHSQDMITSEIITRVLNIKNTDQTGTGFIVARNSNSYIVTARHIFDDTLKHNSDVIIQIFQDSLWKNLKGKLLLHENPKIDIAVIKSEIELATSNNFELSTVGMAYGDAGYFLGFPYGYKMFDNSNINSGFPLPFVKKAILSAFMHTEGISLQFLDGHNNPGFSGGPVVLKNRSKLSTHQWSIVGVVSAYINQKNELVTPIGTFQYSENSGIILSYGIEHALEIMDR